MHDETALGVSVCDANVCDVSVRLPRKRQAGIQAPQVPSLALTRCETSPMSARP